LEITTLDGIRTVREVTGATCEGVISALALVAAMALEGRMASSTHAESTPPAVGGMKTNRGDEEVVGASPLVAAEPTTFQRPLLPSWRWVGGLAAGTTSGFGPGMSLQGALFVDLTHVQGALPLALRLYASASLPQ